MINQFATFIPASGPKTLMMMSLFSFYLLTGPLSAMAATFKVNEEITSTRRAEEIKQIVLDVDNTCDSGCRYRVPNIREMRRIDRGEPQEDRFFMWVYVDSVKDFMYFNEVSVERSNEGKILIHSMTPSSSQIRELQEISGKAHQTYFDVFNSHWTLREHFDDQGNFTHTQITYVAVAETDSVLLRVFSGTLRKEMKKTAKEVLANLR